MMFLIIGIETDSVDAEFGDGRIQEGWITYEDEPNARRAAQSAMDTIYDGVYDFAGLTVIVHPLSGKANEHRFRWLKPTEGQLVACG